MTGRGTLKRRGVVVGVWLAAMMLAGALCVPHSLAAQGQPRPPAAQEEFVPVSELPQDEELPAAPLLAGAYAVAWVLVFGYVWSLWRRLGRVERELQEVATRLGVQRR
jgi:CcmD family protein